MKQNVIVDADSRILSLMRALNIQGMMMRVIFVINKNE